MTQETEDVVGRLRLFGSSRPQLGLPVCDEAADILQSLSDHLAAQNGLLRRARSLIRPYCAADEELRAFSDELTVCLVEEKE